MSYCKYKKILSIAKLVNWNFHPLEVVSRWRDPQLQVSENYSYLKAFEIVLIDVTFYHVKLYLFTS